MTIGTLAMLDQGTSKRGLYYYRTARDPRGLGDVRVWQQVWLPYRGRCQLLCWEGVTRHGRSKMEWVVLLEV